MAIGLIKKQIIHSSGSKASPARFLGDLFAGRGNKRRLASAEADYKKEMGAYRDMEYKNPYAKNIYAGMENTMEDLTVNQQQAQFQAQQGAQARANLMTNLSSAAGGSGIASLAQAMANQQQTQTQQISAGIGQQEAANQRMSAQGAANVQRLENYAEQAVMGGEATRQASENKRQMGLLGLKAGRQDAVRDYQSARSAQNQAMMGGVGDILGAGLSGFASGGGFSKGGFKMDTFLGREGGGVDLSQATTSGSGVDLTNSQYQSSAGSGGYGTAMRRNSQTGLIEEVEFADRFND